ncbi:MAG: hypothetical protein ACJ780_10435 [Solirubrobacteraceae bacterium]
MGDVVNPEGDSMQRLLDELCSAYGRELLVQYTDADRRHDLRSPDRQLPDHVDMCPDLEVLDYIDAIFQISASIIEQHTGADPVEEPRRLASEINRIFEEEGVGYRRTPSPVRNRPAAPWGDVTLCRDTKPPNAAVSRRCGPTCVAIVALRAYQAVPSPGS